MNNQEFINKIKFLNSEWRLTLANFELFQAKFVNGSFVPDIAYGIKSKIFCKKIIKITNKINNEIENYIKYLINKYEQNPNEYEGKKEFLIEHLDDLFTWEDLVGYLDPTYGWFEHKDRRELLNYLYNELISFKNVKKSELDDILSSDRTSFIKLLLSIVVDETLDNLKKELW